MNANIASIVYEQAASRPDSSAFVTNERIVSYREARRVVSILAHHLRHHGVVAGRTVGVSMGHRPLHLLTVLALAQIGAVSLPLHPSVPPERRLLAARRFGADIVVSARRELALVGLDFVGLEGLSFALGSPEDLALHPVTGDTPMRILISSGTSGDPKGMVLTHGNMALRNLTKEAGVSSASRILPMDLNFIVGFRPAMSGLANGATLVFPPSLSAADVLQGMVGVRVTHAYFSPAQAREIASLVPAASNPCPDMVCLRLGGGPVSGDLLHLVQSRLSPNVYVSYGSTEAGMVTYAGPELLRVKPGSVGKACAWARVEVVDDAGNVLDAGTTGQLRIRSDHQVAGYFRDDERTRLQFRAGWFYPGDLGHCDDDGVLYIEGRADEQLNVGGMNINPEDIEATLMAHPAVIDAGAFATCNREGLDVLAAALVLREDSTVEDVQKHAVAKLGPLAPSHYQVTVQLPRTTTGKLQRAELARMYPPVRASSGTS